MGKRITIPAAKLASTLNITMPSEDELRGHEDTVGIKFLLSLLEASGFDRNADLQLKPTLTHAILGGKTRAPDWGILRYSPSPGTSCFAMVADTKPLDEKLEKWEDKLAGYVGLAGALYGILTNGREVVIIKPTRGVVAWDYLSDLPDKAVLLQELKQPREYEKHEVVYAARLLEDVTNKTVEDIANFCHDVIRTRTGWNVPERLYEFSKLLLVRIVDEMHYSRGDRKELRISEENLVNLKAKGVVITDYVNDQFAAVRQELQIFESSENIDLPEDVIIQVVQRLDPYRLWVGYDVESQIDILGTVYEKFLMKTMTGQELGQYFTPRSIVDMLIAMMDLKRRQAVVDPACGTGGFLISALNHLAKKYNLATVEDLKEHASYVRGIDTASTTRKLCQINLWLHGDCSDNTERADSLDPDQAPNWLEAALRDPEQAGFHFVLTNPPFGSKPSNRYPVAEVARRTKRWQEKNVNLFECAISPPKIGLEPQSLFVELCIKALKKPKLAGEGGRLGIIIHNGLLSNIQNEEPIVRRIIVQECILEAVIGLPKGTFKPYGSNVIPVALVLRRKAPGEKQGPIFRAEVSKIGFMPGYSRFREDSFRDIRSVLKHWQQWRYGGK